MPLIYPYTLDEIYEQDEILDCFSGRGKLGESASRAYVEEPQGNHASW